MTENPRFLITDYGARPASEAVQTSSFQACLDAARDAGGGVVIVPSGSYFLGSIRIFDHTTLLLESGAVLRGSRDLHEYTDFGEKTSIAYLEDPYYIRQWNLPPYYFHALICAHHAQDVSIVGEPGSLIDGSDVVDPAGEEHFRGPMGIVIDDVRGVTLRGYTVVNSSNWSHALSGDAGVRIADVRILAGHDGFNLHHSSDIVIDNCRLETGDDCIAGYDVRDLRVTNCDFNTACNSMRLGGDRISFENCSFRGPGRYPHLSEDAYFTHSVFKFYTMTADTITTEHRGIVLDRCSISDVARVVNYVSDDLAANQQGKPLRELTLRRIMVDGVQQTSLFQGNGNPVTLRLIDSRIDSRQDAALLEIDDSVTLDLQNVYFARPSTIVVKGGETLRFEGLTTFLRPGPAAGGEPAQAGGRAAAPGGIPDTCRSGAQRTAALSPDNQRSA